MVSCNRTHARRFGTKFPHWWMQQNWPYLPMPPSIGWNIVLHSKRWELSFIRRNPCYKTGPYYILIMFKQVDIENVTPKQCFRKVAPQRTEIDGLRTFNSPKCSVLCSHEKHAACFGLVHFICQPRSQFSGPSTTERFKYFARYSHLGSLHIFTCMLLPSRSPSNLSLQPASLYLREDTLFVAFSLDA